MLNSSVSSLLLLLFQRLPLWYSNIRSIFENIIQVQFLWNHNPHLAPTVIIPNSYRIYRNDSVSRRFPRVASNRKITRFFVARTAKNGQTGAEKKLERTYSGYPLLPGRQELLNRRDPALRINDTRRVQEKTHFGGDGTVCQTEKEPNFPFFTPIHVVPEEIFPKYLSQPNPSRTAS